MGESLARNSFEPSGLGCEKALRSPPSAHCRKIGRVRSWRARNKKQKAQNRAQKTTTHKTQTRTDRSAGAARRARFKKAHAPVVSTSQLDAERRHETCATVALRDCLSRGALRVELWEAVPAAEEEEGGAAAAEEGAAAAEGGAAAPPARRFLGGGELLLNSLLTRVTGLTPTVELEARRLSLTTRDGRQYRRFRNIQSGVQTMSCVKSHRNAPPGGRFLTAQNLLFSVARGTLTIQPYTPTFIECV